MTTPYAELVLSANTAGLKSAPRDLAAITKAGAATETGVKKAMKGVEGAVNTVTPATRGAAAAMLDLRKSLDPVYAASKQYEAAQKQVTAAVKLGAASQAEANQILALAEKRYLGVGAAANTSNTALGAASKGMNSFAFQSRMAAMQLSQVAQQTMAGGGFIRALSIQLPDLALGFGAVGIAAGVAAGVILPLAANFLTGAGNADSLSDAIDDLTAASQHYISINDETKRSVADLSTEFGGFADVMQRNLELMEGIALSQALDSLNEAIREVDVSGLAKMVTIFANGKGEIEALNDNYNQALADIYEGFKLTGDQAVVFLTQLDNLQSAKGPAEVAVAADSLNKFLIEAYGSARDIPPELREMVQNLGDAQAVAARVASRLDGSAEAAQNTADRAGAIASQLGGAVNQAVALRNALVSADAAIGAIGLDVTRKIATIKARNLALQNGQNEAVAGEIALLKQKSGEQTAALVKGGASLDQAAAQTSAIRDQIDEYGGLLEQNSALQDGQRAAAKAAREAAAAAKKSANAAQSAIDKLRQQIDQEHQLIGLSDKARDQLEARHRVETALASDKATWNEAEIDALADKILLNKELLEEEKKRAKVLGTIFDGISTGNIGSIGSSILGQAQSGFSDLLKGAFSTGGAGITGVIDGLKAGVAGIGAAFKSGAGLIGSLGGAISAALPVIGAVSAALSFFKTKTTELNAGLRVTTDGMTALVDTFKTLEKVKFWGLSKKVSTTYEMAGADIADPIQSAITQIGQTVLGLSDVLGLASDNLQNTSFEFEVITKDKSDAEIQAAITAEMTRLGNSFADAVIGSYTEFLPDEAEIARLDGLIAGTYNIGGRGGEDWGAMRRAALEQQRITAETAIEVVHLNGALAGLQQAGEGSLAMLERIVSNLYGVNESLYLFDRAALDLGIEGAKAATALVDAAGGLEAFSTKTQFVFENMLTDAAQEMRLTEIATEKLNSTLGALGIAIPETHAEFMAMLDGQDLMTEAGRNTHAALLDVASAFVQVNGTAQAAADAVAAQAQAADAVDALLAGAVESALAALEAISTQNLEEYQGTVEAQIDALNDGFDSLGDTLREQISLAESAVRSAGQSLDAIQGAINSRTPDEDVTATQARTASAVSALAKSIERGVLPETEALERILGDIGDTPEAFSTREDYLRDFYKTNAMLAEAEAMAGNSLSIEEQMLATLELQLTQASSQNDGVIQQLQDQLAAIRELPVSLAGVLPTGALSDDLTNALYTAVDAMQFTGSAAAINAIYQDALGRNADLQGLNFYLDQLTNGLGLGAIAADIAGSIEAQTGSTPGYNGNPNTSNDGSPLTGSTGSQPSVGDIAAQVAAAIAAANGTAAFGRPTDFVGNLYGQNGIPISAAGYNFWDGLTDQMSASDLRSAFLSAAQRDGNLGTVPAYRNGTNNHPGGLAYVHSDELVNMPAGSSVSTASQTRSMFDQTALIAEVREVRRELELLRRERAQDASVSVDQQRRAADDLQEIRVTGVRTL